ncbi:MAG: hypothetical protein JWN41_847 [Thermoleophilia bacterium]|nr:hypothetical protein [Thermoleophilia bacterium]
MPIDTAVHELTHVTQFARIPATAKADQGILEGIADAVAMLATGDDTVGEGYFRTDATGRHRGSIRDLGAHTVHGPTVGAVARTYLAATSPGVECHEAGGLISTTVAALRLALGRSRAEKLLWSVIRDSAAWAQGGSWKSVAAALQRAAANDVAAASAVTAALRQTGWDAALA